LYRSIPKTDVSIADNRERTSVSSLKRSREDNDHDDEDDRNNTNDDRHVPHRTRHRAHRRFDRDSSSTLDAFHPANKRSRRNNSPDRERTGRQQQYQQQQKQSSFRFAAPVSAFEVAKLFYLQPSLK
jgi:hypothetical protein